ncbi:MAG: glycoside hydrolase family 36 protein, partial [Bacteroidota bacterium]
MPSSTVQSVPRPIDLVQAPTHGTVAIECLSIQNGIETYRVTFTAPTETAPSPFTLRWKFPCLNVCGVWKSGALHHKRLQYDWEKEHLQARISVDAPVVNVFGHDDENIITFACADAVNLVEMNALLREEDNHIYCHISFFQERHPAITTYQTELRIDTRKVPFYEALQATSSWWENIEAYTPAPVPDLARQPLYSTWYNYHQELVPETLLAELSSAHELGYEFVILDDGWQTHDNNRGYDFTGDWQPERIPDLAGFIEQIHQLGYKAGIWFSVPFCGKKSQAYRRFAGKFLTENHRWAPVFDPRYPDVREYLIQTYTHAVKTYKLDALKLDFIDDFKV